MNHLILSSDIARSKPGYTSPMLDEDSSLQDQVLQELPGAETVKQGSALERKLLAIAKRKEKEIKNQMRNQRNDQVG